LNFEDAETSRIAITQNKFTLHINVLLKLLEKIYLPLVLLLKS